MLRGKVPYKVLIPLCFLSPDSVVYMNNKNLKSQFLSKHIETIKKAHRIRPCGHSAGDLVAFLNHVIIFDVLFNSIDHLSPSNRPLFILVSASGDVCTYLSIHLILSQGMTGKSLSGRLEYYLAVVHQSVFISCDIFNVFLA